MVRFLSCLVGVGVLCVTAFGQAYDVRADAALAKPVTISMKYGAIDVVLKAISKQSGVDVEVSSPVNVDKVTIFAKDVPANILLDRIASVLGGQWKNLSGIRFLSMDDAHQKSLSVYLAAEDVLLRAHAEEDLAAILKRLENERNSESQNANSDAASASPQLIRRGGVAVNRNDMGDQIGKLFEGANSSDVDGFWKGEVASVEVGPGDGSPSRVPGLRRRQNPRPSTDASIIYARYDVNGSHTLQIGSSQMPINQVRFDVPQLTKPEGTLADTKFGKDVTAWSSLELTDAESAFNDPIAGGAVRKFGFGETAGSAQANEPVEGALMTQSDYLEKFFKSSGIPVVADGFRTSLPPRDQEPTGATAIAWLKSLSEQTGAYVQIKDGVASVRQGGFWRLNQYEIPESVLTPLEANAAKLTIVDYANFFAGLNPSQLSVFQSETAPKVAFPTSQLVDQIPALQFIATLGSNFPVNGKPVPIPELGGDSERAAFAAVSQSVFYGKIWNKSDAGVSNKAIFVSIQPADVAEPEGTVSGVSLKITLPMGLTVEYQIPVKLPG